jgi:hypothetical protein
MDCEKFEPLLIDELYDELDELTSAAVKRHVGGCAKCAATFNGMRATRQIVSLPLVALPVGLEDRILAATKEAHKARPSYPVESGSWGPLKSKMSRVVSIAGSWAMRPQTAMAAVFLLMIGTSAFLIRSKNYASKDSPVSVTVEGAPSPTAVSQSNESLDDKAAAAAHGPSTPPNVTRPPAAPAASAIALNDDAPPVDHLKEKSKEDESGMLGGLGEAAGKPAKDARQGDNRNYGPAPLPTTSPMANAAAPAGAPAPPNAYDRADPWAQNAQSPAPMTKRTGPSDQQGSDPFSLGAAAFRARDFATATKNFDKAAQSGDTNAALWAAESTREGQGCAVALGRFDQLAKTAAGSWHGHEASLRAARCQIAMGQLDPARDRLNALARVSSHQQAAQQALGELNQVAARRAGGAGATGGAAAAPKRAAPASRPASPARAPAESMEQKKATDSNAGF